MPEKTVEQRLAELERRVSLIEKAVKPPKKVDPSVGIYYRDGKPMKGKPKKEQG